MKKYAMLALSSVLLSGCFAGGQDFPTVGFPNMWGGSDKSENLTLVMAPALKNWWTGFDDPTLNDLVGFALQDSPDRLIAEARILESRGVRRTARSSLFPQLGLSGTAGRQDNAVSAIDDLYEAGFDASYELDIFGKNRKNASAADSQIQALEAQYQDVSLTLIAEVARSYINFRAFQKQSAIAQKNLSIQEQTLELIRQLYEFGEAPQLDVERAENLVNTTKSSIPEFERLATNAKLQLTVLTGKMPDELAVVLDTPADIPQSSALPMLMAPTDVLTLRPDIRAASANLAARTSLAESVTAELFPSLSLSGFYGVTENVLTSSTTIWNVAIGAAVSILDFGRIEGRIDSARAREVQAYQAFRRTVLAAVADVETALADTAYINEQRISLQAAYNNAERAFTLSETLYKEGEISFLDLLDAQRTVNEADAALITSEAAQAESLVRLYKSLGVY